MARFSIVIPVYNVEAWIRECLDSVVGQTFTDFEVIIVDDCGNDSSIRIASEFLVDKRFSIVRQTKNMGLGPARNRGIEEATGDYVLFLDSDDRLEPTALEAIQTTACSLGDPDLIVFDYHRLTWWGSLRRNQNANLLRDAAGKVFSINDEPGLLKNFHVAWNKAYKRDAVQKSELLFPPGYYEDVPWTYPWLLWAPRIATIPEPLYQYRQRYSGSILSDLSPRHLELFEQYDRMFAKVAELNIRPEHYHQLYRTMFDHYRALVRTGVGRIPPSLRGDYFRSAARSLRRHQPPEPLKWAKTDRLRLFVLKIGVAWVYGALKGALRLRAPLRRRLRPIRRKLNSLRYQSYRSIHRLATRLPARKDIAVYMSYWGRSYSCNPAAIYEAQVRLWPNIRAFWIINNPQADVPDGVEHYSTKTLKAHWLLGRARYAITNVNFPNWVQKRDDAIHLQTQHGTPLKLMGNHFRGPEAPKMSYSDLLQRCQRWDFCLSSNPHSTETWPSAFPVSFRTIELGYPRNDILFDAESGIRERMRAALGVDDGATLLLYTPTHREYDSGFVPRVDTAKVAAQLPPEWIIATRAHHSYGRSSEIGRHSRTIDVSDIATIEHLYLAADVLLTDYSSTMFDFANLLRPIVLFIDDFEEYQEKRGMYFDIRKQPPGPVAATEAELVEILTNRRFNDPEHQANLKAFHELFCPFDDGKASERVAAEIFSRC